MFGRPRLKISDETREMLDERIDWIVSEFGSDYWKDRRVVLDTDIFTVDLNGLQEVELLDAIAGKVMTAMDVDTSRVRFELSVYDQSQRVMKGFVQSGTPGSSSTGRYYEKDGRVLIEIEESQLSSPISLVATIAHELCHHKLLFEKRIQTNDEVLTDILPTFFGFGLFTSAAVLIFSQYNEVAMQGWSIKTGGYLSEYEHGYILARWAVLTNREKHSIMRLLKPNVEDSYRHTLKYFEKGGTF